MASGNNSIDTLPLDIIYVLLNVVLDDGFEGFYNLLKAWAQSQRQSLILKLVEDLPVSGMYKFGHIGSVTDISAFHQFMNVAEGMGIGDAIVYRTCRELFRGSGNIEANFDTLDGLGNRGHFLAKVANWILKSIYRRHTSVSSLHALVDIHRNPYYRQLICQSLDSIKVIYSSIESTHAVHVVEMKASCPIHCNGDEHLFITDCLQLEICLFCEVACMLNNFTRDGCGG